MTKSKLRCMNKYVSLAALAAIVAASMAGRPLVPAAFALEVSFTPNPADSTDAGGDGGPLPVSSAQRRQLLELERVIASSPDPSATLQSVADQNEMSAEELGGMLNRNRKDLEHTGELDSMMSSLGPPGGGSLMAATGGTIPRRILSLTAAIVSTTFRAASVQFARHPKQSAVLLLCASVVLLTAHNAPRNGIILSTGAGKPPLLLLSKGHSTALSPPMDYVQRHYTQRWASNGWVSSLPRPVEVELASKVKGKKAKASKNKTNPTKRLVGGVGMTQSLAHIIAEAEEEGVTMEKEVAKREGYALIVTARTIISIDEFMEIEDDKESDAETYEDETDDEKVEQRRVLIYDSILSVMDDRKFSNFVPGEVENLLQFRSFLVAEERDFDEEEEGSVEGAVIVMKSLGDFGRYGIQPLCLSYEHDAGDNVDGGEELSTIRCIAYHTLKGGHFDGELRFSLEQRIVSGGRRKGGASKGDEGVVVSVTLAVPKGGRSLSPRLAKSIVTSLAESVAESSRMRTMQTLSRRRQSRAYRAGASGSAAKKRHLRYEQEKSQEAMAAERKRRWKRNNPDAGHYRPSGNMMKGPNSSGPAYSM